MAAAAAAAEAAAEVAVAAEAAGTPAAKNQNTGLLMLRDPTGVSQFLIAIISRQGKLYILGPYIDEEYNALSLMRRSVGISCASWGNVSKISISRQRPMETALLCLRKRS